MLEYYRMNNKSSKVIGIAVCLAMAIVMYSGSKILKSNNSVVPRITESQGVQSPFSQKDTSNNSSETIANINSYEVDVSKNVPTGELSDFKRLSEDRGYISSEDMLIYQNYDV